MSESGRYCKAYHAKRFREYPAWTEGVNDPTKNGHVRDISTSHPSAINDETPLFLHESFVVTKGIYRDEEIIFDKVSSDWKQFCVRTLEFESPKFLQASDVSASSTDDSQE